jgi:hypothetical protein
MRATDGAAVGSAVKRVWIWRRRSALPAKSTYTQAHRRPPGPAGRRSAPGCSSPGFRKRPCCRGMSGPPPQCPGAAPAGTPCHRRSCWTRWTAAWALAPKKSLSAMKSSISHDVMNSGRSRACTPSVSGGVERVAVAAQQLVVHRVQAARCGAASVKPASVRRVGLQHGAAGHGPVAIQPLAHGHAGVQALRHGGKAPHRHDAPAVFAGRPELPVAHGVAKSGVGDVVGREREVLHAHAHLAGGQRQRLRW